MVLKGVDLAVLSFANNARKDKMSSGNFSAANVVKATGLRREEVEDAMSRLLYKGSLNLIYIVDGVFGTAETNTITLKGRFRLMLRW